MVSSLDSLTVERLRQHYVQEGKTETEIAKMYGTYQVKVGRLRRAAGIPTLAKTDRLGLPDELTSRLRSILVGSMLGDGRLFRTGSLTAAYSEHHSDEVTRLAQEAGFELERTLELPLGRLGKKALTEPVFVFKLSMKPGLCGQESGEKG